MTYLFTNNQEIKNDVGNPISTSIYNSGSVVTTNNRLPVNVEMGSAAAMSAFGESISVPVTPVVQLDGLYGLQPREFETYTANGGGVETTNTLMKVHTGTGAGGYGVIRSRRLIRYRPGQGAMARFTAAFSAPHANTTQRAGFFAQEQAINIGYQGTQFGILRQNGGKATIFEVNTTSAPNGTQTATITLNGIEYTVTLSAGTTLQAASAIAGRVGGYPGWAVEQYGTKVHFLSQSVGPLAGTFSFSSTGNATATALVQQTGVNHTLYWTYQQNFNIDKLDGTGPSGMVINPSKLNVFQISFRWLGAGEIRFAIENPLNGDVVFFHHIHYSNQNEDVHLDNPSFKLGYVAANVTGSTATNVHVTGASMLGAIEGILTSTNYTRSTSSSMTSLPSSSLHHILTIRNQVTTKNKINLRQFIARQLSVAYQGNDPAVVVLMFNQLTSSPHIFEEINEWSCSTVCRVTTTMVGDESLASFIIPINGSGTFDLTNLGIVVPAGNYLSIAVRSGQTIQSITTSLTWEEI